MKKRLLLLNQLLLCLTMFAQVPFVGGRPINHAIRDLTFPVDSVRIGLDASRDTTVSRADFELRFSGIEILEADGWLESAFAKFLPYPGAKAYHAYVCPADAQAAYTRLDDQLVRDYTAFGRVDAVGLPAGDYRLRIVPVDSADMEITLAVSRAMTEARLACGLVFPAD